MLPHGRTDGTACAHGPREDARPHAGARPTVPLRPRRAAASLHRFISYPFATVPEARLYDLLRGAAVIAPPPLRHLTLRPLRSTRRRTILGVHFPDPAAPSEAAVAVRRGVSSCSGAVTRYQVSYSSFAPPQEPGLQPHFARGAYQCRHSTSGCLLAPLEGSLPSFRERRFPIPVHSLLRPPTQYSPT